MRAALIAALALAAGPALAGTPLLPPAGYDHPYAGRVELLQVPQREVYRICSEGAPWIRSDVNGCAQVVEGVCVIVMVSHRTSRVRNLRDLYRHERAHCNNWPGHHPR